MAITNWAQVGASAHKGDMDRAELQLARRRQEQSEQAQRFGQQRAMALDAEEKRRYDQSRADAQADKAYDRGQAERQYADAQADKAYNRARQERLDVNTEAVQQWTMDRQADNDAFDRMLRSDEAARRQALFEQQNAEYQKLIQQEDERKAALEAGFATLLSNGIARGYNDGRGNILIPKQYIDLFNQKNGTNLSGLAIATAVPRKDESGNVRMVPLPFPQIVTMEQQVGQDGKPLVDQATGQPLTQASVMPMAQVQAMFQAFPGVPESMGRALPQESRIWMQTLGLGGVAQGRSGGMDDGDRLDYEKWAYEQDAKDYRALAGAALPDKEGMSAVSKRMDSRRARMDAMAGGRYEAQSSGEDTQGEEKEEKKPKFSFMAPGAQSLNAL